MDGVASPGLAPEEAARVCCNNVELTVVEFAATEDDEEDTEAFCIDRSPPARRPASLRARSSVWDIVTRK